MPYVIAIIAIVLILLLLSTPFLTAMWLDTNYTTPCREAGGVTSPIGCVKPEIFQPYRKEK